MAKRTKDEEIEGELEKLHRDFYKRRVSEDAKFDKWSLRLKVSLNIFLITQVIIVYCMFANINNEHFYSMFFISICVCIIYLSYFINVILFEQ